MSATRSSSAEEKVRIENIIFNFQSCYQQPLSGYAHRYLATGDEQMTVNIALRAQFIPATAADQQDFVSVVNLLKEEAPSTRVCVLLGAAYEYGIGSVKRDPVQAVQYYLQGSKLIDANISEAESNRDRGHSLANACSITNDPNEALAQATQGAEWGSQLGYAHLGIFYSESKEEAHQDKAVATLNRAPQIFFSQGRLGWLHLKSKIAPQDDKKAQYHFEQAANLGDPFSLFELRKYYSDNPFIHALISYESLLLIAHVQNAFHKEVNEAKVEFKQMANTKPKFFEEQTDHTPWERVAPLLEEKYSSKLIAFKSLKLACIHVGLTSYFPKEINHLIILHICLLEYKQLGEQHTAYPAHLSFWGSRERVSCEEIDKTFPNSCLFRRETP